MGLCRAIIDGDNLRAGEPGDVVNALGGGNEGKWDGAPARRPGEGGSAIASLDGVLGPAVGRSCLAAKDLENDGACCVVWS